MSSKEPPNSNTILNSVRFNCEPSTSSMPVTQIKTEYGSPISTTRLTSFRVPRDLTLGSNIKLEKIAKKVYTPNINVQRNKRTEDQSAVKNDNEIKNKPKGRGRGGPNDRGRGRGKSSNLIQSSGVFSEGITETVRPGRRSSGIRNSNDDREAKPSIEKPKLNLNYTVDKAEEEKKLKLLLRDDFIDHDDEINTDYAPISLPLTEEGKLFKYEVKADEKFTNEEQEADEDDEIDRKPTILENGKAIPPLRLKKIKKPIPILTPKEENEQNNTVPQVIDNHSNGYLMLRFPDCLPGFRSHDDSSDLRPKEKNDRHSTDQNKTEEKTEYCTLNSLKAGYLGKIQIHQSGKAKLILGDNSLVIDVGSRLGFRQDVVAAKINGINSELINLGPISSTLICTPDFESMFAKL